MICLVHDSPREPKDWRCAWLVASVARGEGDEAGCKYEEDEDPRTSLMRELYPRSRF